MITRVYNEEMVTEGFNHERVKWVQLVTRVDHKICYSYNFHIWKNANHTLFMQCHKYRKFHEVSMISNRIFPQTKNIDFFKF